MNRDASAMACDVDAQNLARFRAGESGAPERRKILAHLLAGCARCRDAVREIHAPPAAGAAAPDLARLLGEISASAERLSRELAEAEELRIAFLGHPAARQWTLLRNSPRHRTFGFAQALLSAAFEALYDDPRRALELSRMAEEIAAGLQPAQVPTPRLLQDLRARAAAHVGNAERATGDLAAAELSLARARSAASEGSLDPLVEGELLYFEASLARGQRRLDRALNKILAARRLYREIGESHLEGRATMNLGSIRLLRGEADLAVAADLEALPLVDATVDPHLALGLRHNLVWHSMEAGKIEFAVARLAEFRGDYEAVGDRSTLARFHWLSGRLAEAQRQPAPALEELDVARSAFVDLELPYELAMVSLDMARILSELGRTAEARRIAAETLEIFNALGVEREAIAAWLVFQHALTAEGLTRELLLRLADYFQAAKANPELRFER